MASGAAECDAIAILLPLCDAVQAELYALQTTLRLMRLQACTVAVWLQSE